MAWHKKASLVVFILDVFLIVVYSAALFLIPSKPSLGVFTIYSAAPYVAAVAVILSGISLILNDGKSPIALKRKKSTN